MIKMIVDRVVEYFIITETSKSLSGNGKVITFNVFGLGYELIDKSIRRYERESGTMKQIADDLLDSSLWKVDYIDADFLAQGKHRSFEITSKTVLQAIYDLAKLYNALIIWNTRERTLKFVKPQSVGSNKGLRFQEDKYLESADVRIDATETITRLKPYGKNNITISGVTPMGMPYIETFKWYMFPFEQDSEGNVIKSSHYFTDDLCIALNEYDALVKSKESEFSLLLKEMAINQELISNTEGRIYDLETELKIAWDRIDVSNASVQIDDTTLNVEDLPDDHWDLVRAKDRLEERLEKEQDTLLSQESMLERTELKISNLKSLLSRDNNFTRDQIKQLVQFTVEKEYVNASIEDATDLLEEGKKVFAEYSKPKISARISIVNFLEVIEAQHDWNKLNLGDDVYIEESDLEFSIKAKITQITFNFETKNISLTIENEAFDDDKITEMLENGAGGSAIIGHDKWEWDLSKENNGKINDIINNKWDAEKNAIEAGYEQLIEISERGIIVTSPDEPCKSVIIQAGRVALTQDCGNSWKTAITPDGIWAEYLWGKVISGVNLIIEDESGVWITQGSRTTIYDRDENEVMRLGLVSDKTSSTECFGIKSWNDATQVELTDCVGFAISKWDVDNDDWKKVLWAAPDGTIMSKHMVAEGIKIVSDIGDVILDAELGMMDMGALKDILADLVITPMEKLELTKILLGIHEGFVSRYNQARDHYYSNRNREYDFTTAFDVQKQSFPVVKDETVLDKPYKQALTKFEKVSRAYGRVMSAFLQYLSFKGGRVPTYRPSSSHNIIDAYGTVASDFTPHDLEFDYDTDLMRRNSEVEIEERRKITAYVEQVYNAFGEFDKNLTELIFYSGLQMGEFYNNVIIDDHGFIAVRNDGKYRSVLNATHGLALQQWDEEKGLWVSNLFADKDGTLYTKNLVAEGLKIINSLGDTILDAEKDMMDMSTLEEILVDLVITPMEKLELAKMTQEYDFRFQEAYLKAHNHYYPSRNREIDITKEFNKEEGGFPVIAEASDSNTHSLRLFTDISVNWEKFLNIMFKYINFVDDELPNILPPPDAPAIDKDGKVAFGFFPEIANVDINHEDMKKTIEITHEERRELLRTLKALQQAFAGFEVRLTDQLFYSGLQMGEYYNNIIIDEHGFIAVRNDGKYRAFLNATHGLALQTWTGEKWHSVLAATLNHVDYPDGTLYAQGLVTHNLRIVDGSMGDAIILDELSGITVFGQNGEEIRLNAHDGISMWVKGDRRFWFAENGDIHAKRLRIVGDGDQPPIADIDGSYISDLTVNKLKTLNSNAPQNIVHIQDNYLKLKTAGGGATEVDKFTLTFDGSGSPIMRWGAGAVGGVGNTFVQHKTNTGFFSRYEHTDTSKYSELTLLSTGANMVTAGKAAIRGKEAVIEGKEKVIIKVGTNQIEINENGMKLNGKRIDFVT